MAVIPTNTGLRITMFFDDGNTGWSETHYDALGTTLVSAIAKALSFLVPARTLLLANGPWLKYIRASRDGTFRDAQIAFLPAPPFVPGHGGVYQNNPAWSAYQSAVDWTTALLRGVGGDFYRRQIYISGVPYIDPTDIGAPQTDPVLVQAAQNYANVLFTQNYGFAVWSRDPNTPQGALVPVTAVAFVTIGGQQLWQFTTAGNHNLPQNPLTPPSYYRAFLHGLQWAASPGFPLRPPQNTNGGYQYVVLSPTTFTLPTWVPPGGAAGVGYNYIPGSGTLQVQARSVVTYQSATGGVVLERFTHRKRGRPFDAPVGRSRRRRQYAAV